MPKPIPILHQITHRICEDEREAFQSFSPVSYTLKDRPAPMDILPRLSREFTCIAEVKKASPSRGVIRSDFDPAAIAQGYQQNGAGAISVITEKNYFQGSKEFLPAVKCAVTMPVLRKDFIFHPFQVYESYNLGADCLLLIAALLSQEELADLAWQTESLGMRALIEVHNREELEKVLPIHPKWLGINNRDLRTFQTDWQLCLRLKPLIPEKIPVISESGIDSREKIDVLKKNGFAGVLIGEYLMRQEDPGAALKELLHD